MSAPTIILSAPAEWLLRQDGTALQAEYGCTSTVLNWCPPRPLRAGALHLSAMHPGDIEDWGYDIQDIERRGWPCARDRGPARRHAQAPQRGNARPALLNWLAAGLLALALGAASLLDGPSEHATETAIAQQLEAGQRAEANHQAWLRHQQRICGPNTGWVELPDGTLRCTTKRGRPSTTLLAGANP